MTDIFKDTNSSSHLTGNVFGAQQYGPYITDLYAKPWCRIGAYTIGMLTGFLIHHRKDKIKINKVCTEHAEAMHPHNILYTVSSYVM